MKREKDIKQCNSLPRSEEIKRHLHSLEETLQIDRKILGTSKGIKVKKPLKRNENKKFYYLVFRYRRIRQIPNLSSTSPSLVRQQRDTRNSDQILIKRGEFWSILCCAFFKKERICLSRSISNFISLIKKALLRAKIKQPARKIH